MARNLDTALLRTFVTVAETGGMTSAGNLLHLTQAAVSQQIKRLEDGFGCTLFERDRRGMPLTNAGERLFGRAKRLVAMNDEVWADMTTPAFTGEVKLGVPFDLVGTYLPPILKAFANAYPQVEISLVCLSSPQLLEALAEGKVSLVLVEQPAGRSAGECPRDGAADVGRREGRRRVHEAAVAGVPRLRHLRVPARRVRKPER